MFVECLFCAGLLLQVLDVISLRNSEGCGKGTCEEEQQAHSQGKGLAGN